MGANFNLGVSVSLFTRAGLTLLHSERLKLYTILAFLSAIGLNGKNILKILIHNSHDSFWH